ncbi:hypothetical protein BDZ97DRAFT_2043220 [Flammula alnicola]|nr:hypothetical protein BDZ97DRAFT_2043220 [Flammula alnicola]
MEHKPPPPDNLPSLPDNLPSPPTGMEASADEEEILHSWYQQCRMIWETEQNEPDNGDLESVMDGEMDGDSTDGEEYPDWDAYESGKGLSSWDQLGESYEQDAAGVGKVLGFVYVGNDLASGAERTLHSTQPNHKTNNLTRRSLVCESRGDHDGYALQLSRYHDGIALQLSRGHDGRMLHFTETRVKLWLTTSQTCSGRKAVLKRQMLVFI